MKLKKLFIGLTIAVFTIALVSSTAMAGSKQRHRWEGVAIGVGAAILGHAIYQSHKADHYPQTVYVEPNPPQRYNHEPRHRHGHWNGRRPGWRQLTKKYGTRAITIGKDIGFRDIGWRCKPPTVTGPRSASGWPAGNRLPCYPLKGVRMGYNNPPEDDHPRGIGLIRPWVSPARPEKMPSFKQPPSPVAGDRISGSAAHGC